MNRTHSMILIAIAAFLLFANFPVIAANDPGHDSLYVLRVGDTNITGTINLTGNVTANNLQWVSLLYGTLLDIRANGTILTPGSRPAIQADANELYLDAITNLRLNTRAGTTGVVQIGPTTGSGITLNVSGTIRQQNVAVCLSNGTNCIAGNNTGNVSSVTAGSGLANSGTPADPILDVNVGTGIEISSDAVRIAAAAAGSGLSGGAGSALDVNVGDGITIDADTLIINNASVCRTDGTGCPASATSGSGWINTTTLVRLANNATNVSIGNTTGNLPAIYVDNTNGRVGFGTYRPNTLLDVNGTVNVSGTGNLNIQGGVLSIAGTTTISSTRVGTFGSGTTVNGQNVCLADGSNCPTPTGSGWLNTTTQVYLSNNATNVSIGFSSGVPRLFIDNTNGEVGIRTSSPVGTLNVIGQAGVPAINVTGTSSNSVTGSSIYLAAGSGSQVGITAGSDGGLVNISAGKGGDAGSGYNARDGGHTFLSAGNGGSSDTTNGAPGNISIIAGDAGNGGGTAVSGGSVHLIPGLGSTGSTNGSVIITRGGLGIGSTAPTATLEVNGQSENNYVFYTTGSVKYTGSGTPQQAVYNTHSMITNRTGSRGFAGYYAIELYNSSPSLTIADIWGYYFGGQLASSTSVRNTTGMTITRYSHVVMRPDTGQSFNATVGSLRTLDLAPMVLGSGGANGTISSSAAIHIRDQTTVNGTSYAIYSVGDDDVSYLAGAVGINITAPRSMLDVVSGNAVMANFTGGADAGIELWNSETGSQFRLDRDTDGLEIRVNGTGAGSSKVYIGYNGLVGIGTTTPASTLHVVGEANITGISGDGSGKVVCIKANGALGTCSSSVGIGGTCTCG